jgi:hypothetical protein
VREPRAHARRCAGNARFARRQIGTRVARAGSSATLMELL